MKNDLGFPRLLERFFTQRLMAQRQVSPHTIASYRDTFLLLLQFAEKRLLFVSPEDLEALASELRKRER